MDKDDDFEIIEKVKDYFTYYFIESHLKFLHKQIELILDTNHKSLDTLRKIYVKEIKGEDYIVSVYAINFKPDLIKTKELININGELLFPLKWILKQKRINLNHKIFYRYQKGQF